MVSDKVLIRNRSGLHARPASEFVAAATKFDSRIMVCNAATPEHACNAKSIVSLLTLGLAKGTTVQITADGPDEEQALSTLRALVDQGFGDE